MNANITTERERIKKFLDEVNQELNILFYEQHIKYYIHEDFQEVFFKYSDKLKEIIALRFDNARSSLFNSQYNLTEIGWTGEELEFKLSLWERFKGRVGKGWKWLESKLDIINTFLGSLSSAGIPGLEAISEIKDAYVAARNE